MPDVLTRLQGLQILEPQDVAWIESVGSVRTLLADDVLIHEGETADCLYFVLQGEVAIVISQEALPDEEIARCGVGEILGEMSFVDGRPASTTVKAVESCEVLQLPKQKLQMKVEQDLDFAARFYQELTMRLSTRLRNLSKLLAQSKVMPGQSLRKVLYLFAVLNDNDIDWLITNGRRDRLSTGTVLIEQGKTVEAFYFLLEGALAVLISLVVDGQPTEREIARRENGEIIGEMSFVEAGDASATIRCAEPSFLLAIPQAMLREKMQRDRGFATRFYQAIAIVLVDRLRDDLLRRGFGVRAYLQGQAVDDQYEEDEIPLDVLEQTLLAGTRFKWMINRLKGN
jgi:CRP-like cAMP-binding protein